MKQAADQALREGRADEAAALYATVIASPSSPISRNASRQTILGAFANRSVALRLAGRPIEALDVAVQLVKCAPAWNKARLRLAQCFAAVFAFEHARAVLAIAIAASQSATDVEVRNNVGLVHASEPDMEQLGVDELRSELKSLTREHMCEWLRRCGAEFSALEIRGDGEGRGVVAKRLMHRGEIALQVPLDCILTIEKASQTSLVRLLDRSGITFRSQHTRLALAVLEIRTALQQRRLCVERTLASALIDLNNLTSLADEVKQTILQSPQDCVDIPRDLVSESALLFFAPYVDVLPLDYSNIPIHFSETKLGWLKGSLAFSKIIARKQALVEEFNDIKAVLDQTDPMVDFPYTLDDFVWARNVVITRIFGLTVNSKKTSGLVPMADMLNHKIPRQTRWWFHNEDETFRIEMLESIAQNAEVFDSYGRKCNSRFFVNYGFALLDNDEDNEALLTFEFNRLRGNDELFDIKYQLLSQLDDDDGSQVIDDAEKSSDAVSNNSLNSECKITRSFQLGRWPEANNDEWIRCLSFLRLMSCNVDDWRELSHKPLQEMVIEPISLANELRAITLIELSARSAMASFDSSLKQDEQLLKTPNLSRDYVNCVLMRRGEKRVLLHLQKWVRRVQPLLRLQFNKTQFLEYVQKHRNALNPYHAYIMSSIYPLYQLLWAISN